MTNREIYSKVDLTLLAANSTWEQIKTLCESAVKYECATVCVPQSYIKRIKESYADKLKICTVVGFPLGYNSCDSKIEEIKTALANGADEIDMVINIGDLKNGDVDKVQAEIAALKAACGDVVLKVIIETCLLTDDEKIAMCKAVTNAKADYIKTSTGFSTSGATIADVELFAKHIGENVKIKAAGGVKTREDFVHFIELGCDRIGTSSAVKVLEGEGGAASY